MKVRFYGKLADVFGSEREVSAETLSTVAEVRLRLAADHPGGAETLSNTRIRACIGNAFVQETDVIPEGEVLEFLAPVSGG